MFYVLLPKDGTSHVCMYVCMYVCDVHNLYVPAVRMSA